MFLDDAKARKVTTRLEILRRLHCGTCAAHSAIQTFPNGVRRVRLESGSDFVYLHTLLLPAPALEQQQRPERQYRERNRHRDEHAGRTESEDFRQDPRQGNLAEPEAEETQAGRRPGVAGTVEGRLETHAGCIQRECEADDP